MCKTVNYDELKYRIKYYLEKIPKHDYSAAFLAFPALLKISPRTFQRYYTVRKDEDYQIPSENLVRLAKFFSNYFNERIDTEDLLNIELEEISIENLKHAAIEESAGGLGLVK